MSVFRGLALAVVFLLLSLTLPAGNSVFCATHPAAVVPKGTLNLSAPANLDPRAIEGFINGLVLRGTGDYYAAIANFREALKYDPQSDVIKQTLAELYLSLRAPKEALDVLAQITSRDADFYRLQGTCYQAIGDDQNARKAFFELVRLEPDNVGALNYLLQSYRQSNDTGSAIWALEQITQSGSASSDTWNDLGRLYAARGDTAKTKQAFQNSLALNGDETNLIAYSFLADVYTSEKKYDSAEVVLNKGLQLDGDSFYLNSQLVGVLWQEDSIAKSLPYARKLAELRPTDVRQVRRLALTYFRLDSLKLADSILTELVKEGPDNPADHFFLGEIAASQKKFDVARSQFEILVQMEDSVAQNWQALAGCYLELKDTAGAKATYLQGLRHVIDDSGRVHLTFALAAVQERSGQFDSAAATFNDLLQKWPGYSPALNYLGYMYADKGINLEQARSMLEQALKTDPNNPAYLDSYGWIFYRLNKYDEALDHLKKAADLTRDPVVFEHLGDTYKALGKVDEARQWWEKSLQMDPENRQVKEKLGR